MSQRASSVGTEIFFKKHSDVIIQISCFYIPGIGSLASKQKISRLLSITLKLPVSQPDMYNKTFGIQRYCTAKVFSLFMTVDIFFKWVL